MRSLSSFIRKYAVYIFLFVLVGVVIGTNIVPGFVAIGNDNFSPEINPSLTLERDFNSPGWRTYRVLGIPSDSEQSDLFRTILFQLGDSLRVPQWLLSQGYFFGALLVGVLSAGKLTHFVLNKSHRRNQSLILLGSLFYLSSLLTIWIFFFPVHLFLAAFAFLPFVLWRFGVFSEHPSYSNALLLIAASLLLSTSALTATMFITCFGTLCFFTIAFYIRNRTKWKIGVMGFAIILLTQLFWMLPFATYVKSNTGALRDSLINRKITAQQIESERRYNTAENTPLYFFSWLDGRENGATFDFKQRDLYNSFGFRILGYIPVVFMLLGVYYALRKKNYPVLILFASYLVGFFLIKGQNPPFGFIYGFFQETFPVFAQVFRWQSSKFWPFMAVSLPVIAAYGAVVTCKLANVHYHKKKAGYILLALISLSALVYVFPIWTGDLMRQSMFVKVPQEYYSLSQYLQKTDQHSRIYLAPESNTLYFRNYSWGFWGSVVLNYLIPNPIVEEALVIGSGENESAFQTMVNAYYSDDPDYFIRVLNNFDVGLLLLDNYAFPGVTGYTYDEDIQKNVVENNPFLTKVWQEGKLTLYAVAKEPSKTAEYVYPNHVPQSLDRILGQTGVYAQKDYILSNNQPGTIYPFALPYPQAKINNETKTLDMNTTYQGENAVFTSTFNTRQLQDTPTTMVSDGTSSVVLQSAFPVLKAGDSISQLQVPQTSVTFQKNPAYVSIDDQVFVNKAGVVGHVRTPYGATTNLSVIRGWQATATASNLASESNPHSIWCNNEPRNIDIPVSRMNMRCGSGPIPFTEDAVVSVQIKMKSNVKVQGTVCLSSSLKQSCLNKNTRFYLDGEQEIAMVLPNVIMQGDTLQAFVDFKTEDDQTGKVDIENFTLLNATQSEIGTKKTTVDSVAAQTVEYTLKKGDTLVLSVPLIEGESSYYYQPNGVLVPETSVLFYSNPRNDTFTLQKDGSLRITHLDSEASIYPQIPLVSGDGLGMMFVQGSNTSGVPAEIRIRESRKQYFIWEEKLYPRQDSSIFQLVRLPENTSKYFLDVFSSGIGYRTTESTLQQLVFQTIPQSWFEQSLEPVQKKTESAVITLRPPTQIDTNSFTGVVPATGKTTETANNGVIVALPTARSPYWTLRAIPVDAKLNSLSDIYGMFFTGKKVEAEVVTVNGWKQAWKLPAPDTHMRYLVIFWPNILVYAGYFVLVMLIGGLTVLWVTQRIRKLLYRRKHHHHT